MNHPKQKFTTKLNIQTEGRQRRPSAVARNWRDRAAQKTFLVITVFPLFLIAAITLGLLVRSWPILSTYPLKDLFLGSVWKPSNGLFGFWPFITGHFGSPPSACSWLCRPACWWRSIFQSMPTR